MNKIEKINDEIFVGQKVTAGMVAGCYYAPYTVVEIKTPNKIMLRKERAVYTQPMLGWRHADSVEVDLNGPVVAARKDKWGGWKISGTEKYCSFGEWRPREYWD